LSFSEKEKLVERYALTFPVRPGTEPEVQQILSGYPRPQTEIGDGARLLGTAVFLWGPRVVRMMDVEGPLPLVMRHLASQPAIRATEEALNPLLAEPRDLSDPGAAAAFFQRAMMRRVMHWMANPDLMAPTMGAPAHRMALGFPLRPGAGDDAASVLRRWNPMEVRGEAPTMMASITVFQQADLLVMAVECAGEIEDARAHLAEAIAGTAAAAELTELFEPGWDLRTERGFQRFFAERQLRLVTDRRAEELTGA
jgi:SchA/CurD like domain